MTRLPALGDISMGRSTATAGITAAASVSSPFPRRFSSTSASNHPRFCSRLGNNNRRFNFSSSFFPPLLSSTLYSPSRLIRSSSTIAVTAAARALSKNLRVDRDVEEYWTQILQGVDKPTAKRLIPYIDTSLPLGIPNPSLPRKTTAASSSRMKTSAAAALSSIDEDESSPSLSTTSSLPRNARPPLYDYFLETKLEHPTKIILCRVGEFYETVGIDAILLVQHAGLNPMGKEGNIPRAGCPKGNIRRTTADLVQGAGLSVVICEESWEGYQYGSKKGPKQRYISEICTPARPHFLSGLIDEDSDVVLEYAPPLLGIAPQVGGFSVIEVDADLQTVRVTEGLTEDAVYARVHEGGLAPPLYVHIPPAGSNADRRLTEAISEAEWERRVSSVFRHTVGAIQKYDDRDPVYGMIERVKRELKLKPDTVFRELPPASPTTRPRPLYFSTASNLGLHKTRGVPSLIDYALPAGAPLTSRRWLRKLLLLPPPPKVSLAIHAACAALHNTRSAVPSFPVLNPNNVVLKIRTQEANDTFFRELGDLCRSVANACSVQTDSQLESFASNVLVVPGEETGVQLKTNDLATACKDVLAMIHDVVDHDTVIGTGITSDSDQEENNEVIFSSFSAKSGQQLPEAFKPYLRMFSVTENYKGKIREEKLKDALLAVDSAKQRVLIEAAKAFELAKDVSSTSSLSTPSSRSKSSSNSSSKLTLSIIHDVANNAAWIRIPKGKSSSIIGTKSSSSSSSGLIHPRDRSGKIEIGFYSTIELEAAQDDYRRACSDARDAVRTELRKLAATLQPKLTQLVAAASFAVVASALDAHVREAARRGWSLPQLTFDANSSSSSSTKDSGSTFKVDGMFPYWLGGTAGIDPSTVKNSFEMDGMFLLTGPNMAGKSTLLRSTCAVALLGASGLAIPAASSSKIPYFDAFMLRNFSADSPLEELSSFAVEMKEMRYVLTDATEKSLVLVDELGKGTEARAGAALAGSMLEALDGAGCRGVFATHLHSLLEMELNIPGTTKMMMETEEISGGASREGEGNEVEKKHDGDGSARKKRVERKATWRMVPGESIESLALEVAASQRLPQQVVDRAADLYSVIMKTSTASSLSLSGGGGDGDLNDDLNGGGENMTFATRSTASFGSISRSNNGPSTTSTTTSTPKLTYNLKQAAVLLESTARVILEALANSSNNTSSPTPTSTTTTPNSTIQAQFVPVGMNPPVRTIGASCVYVGQRSDGWYYVGSSDSLQDRIKTHRQRGSKSRIADPNAEFAYVVVFDGGHGGGVGNGAGASAAKSVEAEVIRAMHAAGYPLLSEADARKRYAPVSRNARYS